MQLGQARCSLEPGHLAPPEVSGLIGLGCGLGLLVVPDTNAQTRLRTTVLAFLRLVRQVLGFWNR